MHTKWTLLAESQSSDKIRYRFRAKTSPIDKTGSPIAEAPSLLENICISVIYTTTTSTPSSPCNPLLQPHLHLSLLSIFPGVVVAIPPIWSNTNLDEMIIFPLSPSSLSHIPPSLPIRQSWINTSGGGWCIPAGSRSRDEYVWRRWDKRRRRVWWIIRPLRD